MLAGSYSVMRDLNTGYDTTQPQVAAGRLLKKATFGSKRRTYFIYVANWLQPEAGSALKLKIPSNLYEKAKLGDEVVITWKSGLLGFIWIKTLNIKSHIK